MENDTFFYGIDFRVAFRVNIIQQNQRLNMKPAFLLACYLSGIPAGSMHLSNVHNCKYFQKYLHKQSVRIGDDIKNYQCYCKLVNVNENMRLY